ncbi:MAG: hypothetical protein Q4A21_02160 [bacterium]|nr:hypothetical protein [bacterium]
MTEILLFLILGLSLMTFVEVVSKGPKSPIISKSKGQILVDTSILIDGRFLAVAKTGFINFDILIPRSVVGELQILADGGDDEKRARARYGLDVISRLQEVAGLNVSILADGNSAAEGVDNRLLSLAKKMSARILTADYNLNKVAKVEGIEVLNINELVQSVRADFLPGEKLMLEISSKGSEKKQGVGHLPDGTMVVVENSESLVGATIEVEFIRSLQTAAGKMMFARPVQHGKHQGAVKGRAPVSTTPSSKNEAKNLAENSKKSAQKPAKDSSKNQKNSPKNQPKSPKRRRTQKSAEASLVELANRE